jgi:hypothetical protein
MPQYDVYALCDECGNEHPMGIGIHLDEGPDDRRSIGDIYEGKSRPPQILAIEGHKCLCVRTGKQFIQKDDKQLFLVPVRWTAVDLERARHRA